MILCVYTIYMICIMLYKIHYFALAYSVSCYTRYIYIIKQITYIIQEGSTYMYPLGSRYIYIIKQITCIKEVTCIVSTIKTDNLANSQPESVLLYVSSWLKGDSEYQ